MTDIIIIGAGVTGLLAADVLSEKGKRVLVLEARNRLGGRIITTINNGWPHEGGAEFIHGPLPNTLELLKRFGLRVIKTDGEIYRVKNGTWKKEDDFAEGWDVLVKKLKELDKDITIQEFLNDHFPGSSFANLRKSFKQYVEGYDAADIEKASSFSIRNEMNDEQETQFRPTNGYGGLINSLANSSQENGAVIQLSTVVTKIEWENNRVTVHANDNVFIASKILITIPVPLLAADAGIVGALTFAPPIPDYQQAANQIGYGGVIKVLLTFSEGALFEDGWLQEKNVTAPFFIFGDTSVPTWWTKYPEKSSLLTGWIAGPPAQRWSQFNDKQILDEAVKSLSSLFKKPVQDILSKLTSHLIYNWIKDPFARGAYSYHYIGSPDAQSILRTPILKTIYFAGEALADNSNIGTVEGAIMSAKAAADEILRS